MLSSSLISRSMARILALVSSERWASLTSSRYLAISISMLSEMPSYFSMRENAFTNFASSFSCTRSRTRSNIRCMRTPNWCISFCASSTESSGVFMMPVVMKRRRKSSSSPSAFLGLMMRHTSFSICGMNQMRMVVLATLKQVWKAASTNDSLAAFSRKPGWPFIMVLS